MAPKRVHKAGFHPTAVFGAMAAAAGVGAALGLDRRQLVDALGIAGSMASGIIEYLAEGAWTKRMHAGWAAQSGMRAALLARAGLRRTAHRVRGHARPVPRLRAYRGGRLRRPRRRLRPALGDGDARVQALSVRDHDPSLYRLRAPARRARHQGRRDRRDRSARSARAPCTGCGSRSRAKQRPPNGYAGKFSTPYCIAAGFVRGNVGLATSPTMPVRDPAVLALAAKVRYRIDPDNPYPRNFTGHIRATLADGRVVEERQPHMRGGAHEPLTARRHRGEIPAQRPPRRLDDERAPRGARAAARALRGRASICRRCGGEPLKQYFDYIASFLLTT